MGKRHSGSRALAAVVAMALLFAGLWGAYRVGWQEGYRLGWLVERSGEGKVSPAEPHDVDPGFHMPFAGPRAGAPRLGSRARYGSLGPLSCLRPLFTFLLLALAFSLMAKLFGFWAWRRGWGPAGKGWHRHGPCGPWPHGHHPQGSPCGPHGPHGPHGPRGPMPPWCWGEEDAGEKEPADQRSGEEQVGKVKPE
jgi:hypothetical protein